MRIEIGVVIGKSSCMGRCGIGIVKESRVCACVYETLVHYRALPDELWSCESEAKELVMAE